MIAVSSSGKSFRALANYLAAGRTGEERDRVAWSVARNLPTNDPELAATFMRATAAQSAKVEKPVYHVVLSFDPADMPDRATMERVADRVLDRLGLAEHQTVIVAHRDRTHAHVHLLVNRVHPELGRAWERWKDQPVIQQVLRDEEIALGIRTVKSSLTLGVEIHTPAKAVRGVTGPTSPEETRQLARPRQSSGDNALNEVIDALEKYELVSGSNQVIQATRSEIDAVQARATRLELTHARAQAASEQFRHLLAHVYRDAEGARRSFMKLANESGTSQAARTMAENPERFGSLLMIERRILGLRTVQSDEEARRHVPAAARAGQAAVTTETEMWRSATEARVRRLEEAFGDQLRTVFVDEKAARAAFLLIAMRDGTDVATATLRNVPSRLGDVRPDVPVEPNARTRLLDRAAAAGVELVRARDELGREGTAGGLPTVMRPRDELAIAELQATRAHVVSLTGRERATRESLSRLPRRGELEHRIIQAADRLLPYELRKLKTMVTTPRLALLAKIRSTVRDAILARDERSA